MTRSAEEGVGLDDLDELQTELELMLVDVSKRSIAIETEIDALANWQELQCKPREKKGNLSTVFASGESSSGKRRSAIRSGKDDSESTVKRLKTLKDLKESSSSSSMSSTASSASSSSTTSTPVPPTTPSSTGKGANSKTKSKSKNVASKLQQHDYDQVASNRNDIPDRFYQFIEQYCGPISEDQLKLVDEMIKAYDDDSEYFKIPNLCKHYSLKKAASIDESTGSSPSRGPTATSSKANSPLNSTSNGTTVTGDSSTADSGKGSTKKKSRAKKGAAVKETEAPSKINFGIFTQRVLQSLLEDPVESIGDLNNGEDNDDDSTATLNDSVHPSGASSTVLKALSLGNTALLEKRIKKELQDCGLLDLDDSVTNDPQNTGDDDDEILKELISAQNELKFVITQNKAQLSQLRTLIETNLKKQQLERQLAQIDEEVKEGYKKLQSIKAKKRNPSKKERDVCLKALKEREEISKQIDALQMNHPFTH